MNTVILIMSTLFIVASIAVIITLNLIQMKRNKKIKKKLEQLEYQKNIIDGTPIVPELSKIKSYLKNEKLEIMYKGWKERLDDIKETQIPRITDMLIEADYSLSKMDYKSSLYKIAKLEMELYKVRTNSEFLLNEIKEITSSEERNRAVITKLKATYRDLLKKFTDNKSDYGEIAKSITLQFENIAKKFEDFEEAMENNQYIEVASIIKALDEMLKHMTTIVEEVPPIVITATSILPKRIKEIEDIYKSMLRQGYPLDYLNVDYNINEAKTKINDIMERTKVLNLEDSMLELKVLIEYFDNLFNDFEKEKAERNNYDETNNRFKQKLDKIDSLVQDIFAQIGDIKNIYNLSDQDMILLNDVKEELKTLKSDYKILMEHTGNNTFAFSKLTREIENLFIKLTNIEDRLDNSLDAIGSMKEDEVRARQQLEEIKLILKEAKSQMREYNLPVVPRSYYIELKEAKAAIKEIVKELDKKPITISVLNTRVDTARDLALKLFSKTKEIMKTAMFAEMAIVYGNRYRSKIEGLDKNLSYSETLFYQGEYKKSLDLSINTLDRIEHGIYDKLLKLYGE